MRARQQLPSLGFAVLASLAMAWIGLYGYAWNDFDDEALPSLQALVDGHIGEFLRLAPAYGGSLVERAPFALLTALWDGGPLAIYRATAAPCLVAAAFLGVFLVAQMRAAGASLLDRGVMLAICVANPLTLRALELGHPEELLGGALCVAAVLVADRGHAGRAALLLGLAIANKPWALLAVGPVLIALPARRALCLSLTAAVSAVVLAPLLLVSSGTYVDSTTAAATSPNAIFQPWQIWWFLGHHGDTVTGLFGNVKEGYRTGPEWVSAISHRLIVLTAIPLTALSWRFRARATASHGSALSPALLLLALLMLSRCLLDPWNTVYYVLPFVLAIAAWEALCARRTPATALSATVLCWISFVWLPDHGASADTQAAVFLAWTVPLVIALALRLYAPRLAVRPLDPPARRRRAAQSRPAAS